MPIVSWPACCSARAAASITTPFPVPAGPTRTARRSGPVSTSRAAALLGAQRRADALGDFARCVGACSLADVSASWLGEQLSAPFDRLLFGAHGQRGHSAALQREDSPVADHLPRHGERLLGCHLSRSLLQRDGVQVACVEHGVLLCQPRLDAVLDRPLNLGPLGCPDQATASSGPKSWRRPVSLHARRRSARVVSSFARRFSSARLRSSPRSGARP